MNRKSWTVVLSGMALLVSAAASTAAITRQDVIGSPAPLAAAYRTITVAPGTCSVNVEGGEIVRFVVGGREFAWNFDVWPQVTWVDLNEIAPPGLLDHRVTAYVSINPIYAG